MCSSLGIEVATDSGGKIPKNGHLVDKATSIVLAALKTCRDLKKARKIHAEMVRDRESNIYVATALVNTYAKCGSIADAKRVFDRMESRDVVSWTTLIMGYAENGQGDEALRLFGTIEARGDFRPNSRTFVAALKACSVLAAKEAGSEVDGKLVKAKSLEMATDLHSRAVIAGVSADIFVVNTMVDVYANCGAMVLAREVFDKAVDTRTVVSWNALMLGYAENGDENVALELFETMLREDGILPNSRSFVAVIKACSGLAAKEEAKKVDGKDMKVDSLRKGMKVYSEAASSGFVSDLYVASALVDMFAKCGSLSQARRVFDKMEHRNSVAWNAIILGYAESGEPLLAIELFRRMGTTTGTCSPDCSTYVAVLKACTALAEKEDLCQLGTKMVKFQALKTGMEVHVRAVSSGCHRDSFVENLLVDMYATCRNLVDAHSIFDRMVRRDVISWTALIRGYIENNEPEAVLVLFQKMFGVEGCSPNARSYLAAIKACACVAEKELSNEGGVSRVKAQALETGMAIHSRAAQDGFVTSNVFVPSSLVDMYAKCGSMLDARSVFDVMPKHDVVSWTALILGYAENDQGRTALDTFVWMQSDGCRADSRTYAAVVKACASAANLEAAKAVHGEIYRLGFESSANLAASLIDCYGKCGNLTDSQLVFDSMISAAKDPVCWSTLISSYSRQGDTERVFGLFDELVGGGLEADAMTYLCVLTACGHAGLVETGKKYFREMVAPGIEHYHSVIDLLGRANRIDEAVEMVQAMPFQATGVTWRTVLGACCKWKNVELGRIAFRELIQVDPSDSSAYSMMANLSLVS